MNVYLNTFDAKPLTYKPILKIQLRVQSEINLQGSVGNM